MNRQAATIQVEHVDDIVVINVSGHLHHPLAGAVADAVKRILNDGSRRIVLDLCQATRVEDEAVEDILTAVVEARRQDAEIVGVYPQGYPFHSSRVLVNPPRPLLWEFYDTREEALELSESRLLTSNVDPVAGGRDGCFAGGDDRHATLIATSRPVSSTLYPQR
jgi:anti-anti-sigma regulatory factor